MHISTSTLLFQFQYIYVTGHEVAQLVEALRYKPEGRGLDWNFFIDNRSGRTVALGSTQPVTEISKGKGKALPLQARRVPGS